MSDVVEKFTLAISYISDVVLSRDDLQIQRTRFRNQADFYSLFGAVAQLRESGPLPTPGDTAARLFGFIGLVDDEARRQKFKPAEAYYAAARSASNDPGPRQTRINTIVQVISAPDFLPQAS